ncbi:Hypothetical protein NocV09_02201190 [Nannochloropsis oceanica]
MGGTNASSNNPFRAEQTAQMGEEDNVSSTAASATHPHARLCEPPEASLCQALADKEAALTRLQDHEILVKELVQTMDNIIKEKETLQTELDAARRQTQAQGNGTDASTLAQAMVATNATEVHITSLEAQLQNLTAEGHTARAEILRLTQELATAKDDVLGLTRWNRQEMRDRREAEQESETLRERVAQMSRRLRRVAERAREDTLDQHTETSGNVVRTHTSNTTTTTAIDLGQRGRKEERQQDRKQERKQGRKQERQQERQQQRQEERQQQQQQQPLLQAKVTDLENELQYACCLRESLETAVVDAQEKLDQCQAELRTALDRLTGLEALVETHEAGKNLVDEAQGEIERLELANHDLQREIMGLEALLEEARQITEVEKRQVTIMEVGLEEATAKAQASVDKIIQLKMTKADLIERVSHLEVERAQDQARISLMQEERDDWRKRAEDEVYEWVGISGEPDAYPEDKPKEVTAMAEVTEAIVDARDYSEVETAVTTTTTTGAAAAATTSTHLTPPKREELGGLDPVEALMKENLALRAQIEGLRRREAEVQSWSV